MPTSSRKNNGPVLDPNATGAAQPPPGEPGDPRRERHEREAAFARAQARPAGDGNSLCAPDLPGLRSDLLFTLVAENVRDYAIFLMDANGIIKCWGEGARLMKWFTRQQAEGAHLRLLYPDGGSEDGTAEQHLQMAAHRGEYNGEGHRIRSDGSLFWAYVTLTALRDDEGKLAGFAKVTRDFTARRAVEQALRQTAAESERIVAETSRQKQIIANISHELRAPVNAMLGYVSLLESEVGGRDQQQAHIERLKRSGRHLLDIINDVLDVARAEAGALRMARAALRIGPPIEEALAEVQGAAAARGVSLCHAVSGTAVDHPYLGDEGRVRQIIVNLLTNAIKVTDPGGSVTISGGAGETVSGASLSGPGPWIYVRVEDTGRGISPERLGSLFERFHQAEPGDEQQGAGLGLSISREFARAMGGDITVHSELGVGSTFTLWLPIAPSDQVPR